MECGTRWIGFNEVKVHVHVVPHVVVLLEVLVEPAWDVLELVAYGRHSGYIGTRPISTVWFALSRKSAQHTLVVTEQQGVRRAAEHGEHRW